MNLFAMARFNSKLLITWVIYYLFINFIILPAHALRADSSEVVLAKDTKTTASSEEMQTFSTITVSTTPEYEYDLSSYGPDLTCKIQPNGYTCNGSSSYTTKFYYDIKMEDCKTYDFGVLCKSDNQFSRLKECHSVCREEGNKPIALTLDAQVACILQPDFGNCEGYVPMWYFDVTERTCKGFSWSGCGGNLNRFKTNQACLTICSNAVKNFYKA